METLIIKLGAAGDVVRTTTLLHRLPGDVDWLTADENVLLLRGISRIRHLPVHSEIAGRSWPRYDLVINLEDTRELADFAGSLRCREYFGARLSAGGEITYSENSRPWFDLSLISRFGLAEANRLKYENRLSFQELIFRGLGFSFTGERYVLPSAPPGGLTGDVAIAPVAGRVWPMKNWHRYDELAGLLRAEGLTVNFLPLRPTMLDHLADVRGHRCLISGDSLSMHLALGCGIRCLTLFICTSPAEIHPYGLMKKIVSPRLEEYFYRRDFDPAAPETVSLEQVKSAFDLLWKGKLPHEH